MFCIFNMPPEENNACKCRKVIAFGTGTKRNKRQSELLSAGNMSTNGANVLHIFVWTSSDLIVHGQGCLYFLPHLTWYVIFCAVSCWFMKRRKDNGQVECNVDFFDSGNSDTFSYSRYGLNDLAIGTNNSRSWNVSNVQSPERSLM